MIRVLRSYFLSRLLREKILLIAFIALGMLWWLSAFGGRAAGFWREQRTTTLALEEQQQWIENRVMIEEAAQTAAAQLKPELTYNETRLFAEVARLASEAGLRNWSNSSQAPVSIGQFSVHTLNFTVNNTAWEQVMAFYALLQQRAPYIGIDQFILAASRANPAQLSLQLRVSSVEIGG